MGFPISDIKTGPDQFADVAELVRDFVETVADDIKGQEECWGEANIEEVEHESRSGFCAYTNGGFDCCIASDLGHVYGSGSVPADLQKYVDSDLADIKIEWNKANPDHEYDDIFAPTPEELGQLALFDDGHRFTEAEHWKEKYWEFESEWMSEGNTYFYKIRALYFAPENSSNETGEREVYFLAGLCTDFEYGRDSGTIWKYEKTVKAADITQELIDEMKTAALAAF